MPNSPSAAKRMRQNAKRRKRNRSSKKLIKALSKRTMTALVAKDFDQALVDFKAASSKIDKAGARRLLHPNTAARRKSKLARAYFAALTKSKQA
jgi:small subunit ribosomal protein S20